MPTYAISVETAKEEYVACLINKTIKKAVPWLKASVHVPVKPVYKHLTARVASDKGSTLELEYKPTYPGYILLESEDPINFYWLCQKWRYKSWFYMIGRTDKGFAPLDNDEVEWTKRLEEPPSKAVIRDGKLHVISGSLKGHDDRIVAVKASRNNVCISTRFRGRPRRVWVAMEIIKEEAKDV